MPSGIQRAFSSHWTVSIVVGTSDLGTLWWAAMSVWNCIVIQRFFSKLLWWIEHLGGGTEALFLFKVWNYEPHCEKADRRQSLPLVTCRMFRRGLALNFGLSCCLANFYYCRWHRCCLNLMMLPAFQFFIPASSESKGADVVFECLQIQAKCGGEYKQYRMKTFKRETTSEVLVLFSSATQLRVTSWRQFAEICRSAHT